jgi:phage terminase large subunit-like protein
MSDLAGTAGTFDSISGCSRLNSRMHVSELSSHSHQVSEGIDLHHLDDLPSMRFEGASDGAH